MTWKRTVFLVLSVCTRRFKDRHTHKHSILRKKKRDLDVRQTLTLNNDSEATTKLAGSRKNTDNTAQIVLRHSYPQITCYVVVDLPVQRQIALAARLKLHTKLEIFAVSRPKPATGASGTQFHIGFHSFDTVHSNLVRVKALRFTWRFIECQGRCSLGCVQLVTAS